MASMISCSEIWRGGELDNEAVHLGVVVERFDRLEKFLFGHVVLKANQGRFEPAYLAGLDLVGDIGFRTSVMANENGHEMGTTLAGRNHGVYFGRDLMLDVLGYFFSVDKCHSSVVLLC